MSPKLRKPLVFAAVIAVLLGVFVLYTRPQTMVALADFMWACFN